MSFSALSANITKVSINGFLVAKETVELRRWESETKIWFHQMDRQRLNYQRKRFGKLTFRALALRQRMKTAELKMHLQIDDVFRRKLNSNSFLRDAGQ